MATTSTTRTAVGTEPATYGLLANGTSGSWTIEVDGSAADPERLFLGIDGPLTSFSFEIPAISTIDHILRFLRPDPPSQASTSSRFVLGGDSYLPVSLIRDDEFDDRFFLIVGPADKPAVRYTISGSDLNCLVTALEQVRDDL
jgi:hypothetical protein